MMTNTPNDDEQKYSVILVPFFSIALTIATLLMGITGEHQKALDCSPSGQTGFELTMLGSGAAAVFLGIVEAVLAHKYKHTISGRVAFVAAPLCLLIGIPVILYSLFVANFCLPG